MSEEISKTIQEKTQQDLAGGLPSNLKDEESQFLVDSGVNHRMSQSQLTNAEKLAPTILPLYLRDRLTGSVASAFGWAIGKITGSTFNLAETIGDLLTNGARKKSPTGVETLLQFKQRHGDTPNREENLNPLGLDTPVVNVLKEIESAFSKVPSPPTSAQISTSVDSLRRAVFEINAMALSVRLRWNASSNKVLTEIGSLDDADVRVFKRAAERLSTYLDDDLIIDVSQNADVESQLFQLKTFFTTLASSTSRILAREFATNSVAELSALRDGASEVAAKTSAVIVDHKEIAQFVTERVRNLDPRKGEFQPRGENQQLDLSSYAAFLSTSGRYRSPENDPNLRNFRKTYLAKSLSSVPKISTDFGNVGPSERDVSETASHQVKSMPIATPALGSGEKAQRDSSVDTLPAATPDDGPVGPLDKGAWNQYKTKLGQRESGNSYDKVNTIGFAGRWQFGAPALIDAGYVKPGTSTRSLHVDANWTGKNGISSRKDWLANKGQVQDKAMLEYTQRNYKALLRAGVISKEDSPQTVAGYLAAAHLKGVGGAKKLKNGQDNADAYGTKASTYFRMMQGVGGEVASGEAAQVAARLGGSKRDQNRAQADANTVEDSPRARFPSSDSSAVRYPYNKVKTYEAGHFKEYDSTPGNERIKEHHRTGTGYEIDSNGNFKQLVVQDNYVAVMGSNWIIVHGHCHITANGDVTIRAGGNVNLNAENDLNMIVGGNWNVDVGGDIRSNVNGSTNETVRGDRAMATTGFMKMGADGDIQVEGASANLIARDTQVNIAAKTDINALAVRNFHAAGKAKVGITSKGDVGVSAGGTFGAHAPTIGFESSGDFGIKAGTFKSDAGTTTIKSGSDVVVTPQVNRAKWSSTAALAEAPGPAPRPGEDAGSYGYGGKDESSKRQTAISSETYDKAVGEFNPVNGKTQANGSGDPSGSWDGKGYDKGVEGTTKTEGSGVVET